MATDAFPTLVTPNTPPFDQLELAKEAQRHVCRNSDAARKYTSFYVAGVYGGIATAYALGCSLRCIFCWSVSRDHQIGGRVSFYSPDEVLEELLGAARRKGVKRARISGAEPTLCKAHLLKLLPLVEESDFESFILETNGTMFGLDISYAREVAQYEKVHIRVGLKAGSPAGYQRRTGALGVDYKLPFRAVKNLLEVGASFHVAAMTDVRLMSAEERKLLIQQLAELSPRLAANLEEEVCDRYPSTQRRLEAAGVDIIDFFVRRKPLDPLP
ncbi:MAG: radical SAM protein [Promethearchaeota archaeon]